MQTLDYAGAVSKLLGLLGHEVDVSVSGTDRHSPLCVAFTGLLERGGEVYGGYLVGLHPDAVRVNVGDVQVVLNPGHFRRAEWREDDNARELGIEFGHVVLGFRAASPD
jgi:hypothetical protein